jgi:hypothetical protein
MSKLKPADGTAVTSVETNDDQEIRLEILRLAYNMAAAYKKEPDELAKEMLAFVTNKP